MHIEQILRAYNTLIFRLYKRLVLRPTPKYPRVTLDFQDSMSEEKNTDSKKIWVQPLPEWCFSQIKLSL